MKAAVLFAIAVLPVVAAGRVQDGADGDIVVTGQRLAVRPGEWLFERGPTRMMVPVTTRSSSISGPRRRSLSGFRYRMCIGKGDMRDAIGMMLGDDPTAAGGGTCAPPRLRIADGRINGGYRCHFAINRATAELRVSGTVGAEAVDLVIRRSYESAKGAVVLSLSDLTARRLGECAAR